MRLQDEAKQTLTGHQIFHRFFDIRDGNKRHMSIL
jgi:hypothetical protein